MGWLRKLAGEVGRLEVPAPGTRGRRVTDIFFKLLRPPAAGQISRYRKNASAEPPKMRGVPLVLLTTLGASTGRVRTTVLGGFEEKDGRGWWSGPRAARGRIRAGSSTWRNPGQVGLEIGNRKFHVRPELIKGDEYEAAYRRIVADSPQYGGYRKVTDREIPVVRLTPIS